MRFNASAASKLGSLAINKREVLFLQATTAGCSISLGKFQGAFRVLALLTRRSVQHSKFPLEGYVI